MYTGKSSTYAIRADILKIRAYFSEKRDVCTRVRGRYTGKCYTSRFRATAERKVRERELRAKKRERNIAFKHRRETHLTRV